MFGSLLRKHMENNGHPFLTINLAMYTVGHLLEALLAQEGRHPGAPVRGVPHADRGVLLKSVLVQRDLLEQADASAYDQLVLDRDTFIEGGIPDHGKLSAYLDNAKPLIAKLRVLVNKDQGAE